MKELRFSNHHCTREAVRKEGMKLWDQHPSNELITGDSTVSQGCKVV